MAVDAAAGRAASFADLYEALATNVARVIQGKDDAVDLAICCLVAQGHLLVEDVPGVGKTTLAKALATSIDVPFGRIQFTPDLLPTDVIGVSVWDRQAERFEFRPGPIFANVVLADEVNRASPKTQAALLEAMAEQQVTVDGTTHHLPPPFLVIATQNPLDHEGTYPLPESQLDRFLLRISMGYPDRDAELRILEGQGGDPDAITLDPVLTAGQVNGMVAAARTVRVDPALQGYLVDLATASRRHPLVRIGMSPRATLALQRVARARAATRGRSYVTPDDIKVLAGPVLAHRLRLRGGSASADAADGVVAELLAEVPVPVVAAT